METKYIIGIDLHGTLLDNDWKIKPNIIDELKKSLDSVKDFCKIYVCSGNDLTFIQKYIPAEIKQYFDGYILETGCVISEGIKEEIIIPENLIMLIKDLRTRLEERKLNKIKYFARRLITISMFTKNERGGIDPSIVYPAVKKIVKEMGYEDKVLVTHSNVAIDIIPKGYNKFTGMKKVSNGLKTIGIADSLNDLPMIQNSDFAFIPHNVSPKIIKFLKSKTRKIAMIDSNFNPDYNILRSRFESTETVIDSLRFINKNLRL